MKRLLFLIIAANLLIPASAHKYLQQGLSWQRTHYERVWDYTLNKDTVIGGKHYLSGEWLGLYRDDETGIYMYRNSCNEEMLVFPYGAQVGDTLHISNLSLILPCDTLQQGITPGWGDYYGVVTSVDTVTLLNGEQRRRIFYSGGRHNWYIEGIGGPKGWMCETVDWELDDTDVWLCYYIDSTLIWASNDCDQWQSKYPNACLGYTPLKTADTWFGLIYKVPGMFESEQFEDIHYILTSDTTIGEHTYRKLIQNDTICVGGLRQTEDGMKVYYYDMVSPSNYPFSHVDCLLYDFTANVGDTIKNVYFREEDIYTDAMHGVDFGGSVVLKKDTIDDRIHMKVGHCDIDGNGPYYVTTWIQGIGTRNVIWPDLYGLPGKGWINEVFTLCALHGDEELYTFSLPDYFRIENNCTEWHFTGLNDIPADNSRNRKFLRNGHIYIETPLGTFDATGRKAE